MKKLLLFALLTALFIGCSDDDEDIYKSIHFNGNDLEEIGGIGDYYLTRDPISNNITNAIYLPKSDKTAYAYDAICPNKNIEHASFILMALFPNYESEGIRCTQCNSTFDLNTGKGNNEKAKGLSIFVYDIHYDEKSNNYRLTNKKESN